MYSVVRSADCLSFHAVALRPSQVCCAAPVPALSNHPRSWATSRACDARRQSWARILFGRKHSRAVRACSHGVHGSTMRCAAWGAAGRSLSRRAGFRPKTIPAAKHTPNFLASQLAAATTPRSREPPTATGLPRSSGLSRCSTEAKNASMSIWMILRCGTRLAGATALDSAVLRRPASTAIRQNYLAGGRARLPKRTEAFPWDTAPKYLIRDSDRAFGGAFISVWRCCSVFNSLL